MTDKTTEELIHRAMEEIGRKDAGEAPSDDDFNIVNGLVEPLIELLNADDVVYIPDIDAIEPMYFLPLARLLAIEASNTFGTDAVQTMLARNRAGNVDALKDREEQILRRITASKPTYAPLKTQYF